MEQKTGEDLNEAQTKRLMSGGDVGTVAEIRNPERPTSSFVPNAPDLDKASLIFSISLTQTHVLPYTVLKTCCDMINVRYYVMYLQQKATSSLAAERLLSDG